MKFYVLLQKDAKTDFDFTGLIALTVIVLKWNSEDNQGLSSHIIVSIL